MSQDAPKPEEKRIALRMRVKKRLVQAVEQSRSDRISEEGEKDAKDEELRRRFSEAIVGKQRS